MDSLDASGTLVSYGYRAYTRGGRLRLVIDLYRSDDGVEGIVAVEGASKPQRFSGWLDLLRLLEGLEGLEPPDKRQV